MIKLAFYIHNHQPVGNFDQVFEHAYAHSYRPLLEKLLMHRSIRFGIHNSGPLCEWMEKKHPEYFEMLREAVSSKQAEILSSAFSEPILSLIPQRDLLDQIKYFNDYLYKKFEYQPKGLWLTERVWEPALIPTLLDAGIEYTMLDDTHFRYAGLSDDELVSHFITEEEGRILKVFPISMKLRYLIPFHQIEETIDFLKEEEKARPNSLKSLGDDGEKFGVWPGTYQWVFGHNWLEGFLGRLEQESWIQTVHLSDVSKEPAAGRIYLPTASYEEMGEWVLPQKAGQDYDELRKQVDKKYFYLVHGGYFKNFLSRYPEANMMHKRMLYVSRNTGDDINAKRALWRGQCSCAYWHGIFGGLYLPHLREGIYRNLIEAEDANIHEGLFRVDFDVDGHEEIVIATRKIFGVIRPESGAFIEIDERQRKINILNYLGRRKEKYHRNLPSSAGTDEVKSIHELVRSKEKDLAKYLIYDKYERGFGLDHLLVSTPTAQDFYLQQDNMGPMINYPKFELPNGAENQIRLIAPNREKTITIANNESIIRFSYKGDWSKLGVEFSVGIFNPNLRINGKTSLYELQVINNIQQFSISGDNLTPLQFSADTAFILLSYPIETISSSESGFEKNFQGFSLLLVFISPPNIEVRL